MKKTCSVSNTANSAFPRVSVANIQTPPARNVGPGSNPTRPRGLLLLLLPPRSLQQRSGHQRHSACQQPRRRNNVGRKNDGSAGGDFQAVSPDHSRSLSHPSPNTEPWDHPRRLLGARFSGVSSLTRVVAPLRREVGRGLHACYWSVSKMASKWGMGCKQGNPDV